MTVDATEHANEQRLNAKLDHMNAKIEALKFLLLELARGASNVPFRDKVEKIFDRLFHQYHKDLSGIAEAARLLKELENE